MPQVNAAIAGVELKKWKSIKGNLEILIGAIKVSDGVGSEDKILWKRPISHQATIFAWAATINSILVADLLQTPHSGKSQHSYEHDEVEAAQTLVTNGNGHYNGKSGSESAASTSVSSSTENFYQSKIFPVLAILQVSGKLVFV